VGAGVLASAVGMDKAVQKTLLAAAGLPVVPHLVVHEREWERDRDGVRARAGVDIGLPAFVKPATLGSSIGITKVKRSDELPGAIEQALSYGGKALIERSMDAREIECAVLGNDEPLASVAGEIIPSAEWYDFAAKYVQEGTRLDIPANLPPLIAEEVRRMAVVAFQAIDASGMARVDFFLRDPDLIVVNEINTIPGFTPISMFPKLWEASGLPYDELISRLIDLAIERHERARKRGTTLSP
jgi:D-alanine-D-alanine ligase